MNQNTTEIIMVVDRSGSMERNRWEAQKAIQKFIEDQQKEPGKCNFSLIQFDTEYEFVYRGEDIQKIDGFVLEPRGMTALLDAVGRAINETHQRIIKKSKNKRPSSVIFVIMTDGLENASKEITCREKIKEMIENQQEKYNWIFTFLGSGIDAFSEGRSIGTKYGSTANFNMAKASHAMNSVSSAVSRTRSFVSEGKEPCLSYTEKERENMSSE